MAGLNYVGATPAGSQDLATKLTVANLLAAATPSAITANSDVINASNLKAGKVYVDSTTAGYSPRPYYQTQDALNVPWSKVGQLDGVAGLDSNGQIPLEQTPAVGAGYVLGPFGATAGFAGSTDSTPLKIADWDIGVVAMTFEPQVFCVLVASAEMGRPVIEVGISNGATSAYDSQTIIARGLGRSLWTDGQVINVRPVPAVAGHQGGDPTVYTPSYHVFCSAWLWDAFDQSATVSDGAILSGAVLLWRTQE